MQAGNNPSSLTELHRELAAKYAFLTDIYKDLDLERARFEIDTKYIEGKKPLSDRAVEVKWLLTEGGQKETRLKWEMRGLTKMMASITTSNVVSAIEAKNMF